MALPLNINKIIEKSGRPELAGPQWERLAKNLAPADLETRGATALLSLLGNSQVLVHFLLRQLADGRKDIWNSLAQSHYWDKPKPAEIMKREAVALIESQKSLDFASAQREMRTYKYRELTRIAARDLSGLAAFEETGRETADLASACAEAALNASTRLLGHGALPFTVIGMGKLGGGDLNFSSDIDLIYLHGAHSKKRSDERESLELFSKLSERFTRMVQEHTQDGFGFRVDLDLRPEGKSGVLVNSLEALLSYYEISGADWERAAWIKGRPIAGDASLGDEAIRLMQPYVYRKLIGSDAIASLKAMKAKIHESLAKKNLSGGFHLKLGRGGIREIEFFVSAFQLIYGGKEPALRERNTLKALQEAERLGLVPREDAEGLRQAYMFLRRAENRLQMEEERQTHALPKEASDLHALARRCGHEGSETFMKELNEHTKHVATCFEGLAS